MSRNGPYDLLSGIYRKQLDAFRAACADPRAAQTRRLAEILASAADTDFGRRYELDRITSPDAYRERVPIHTYDDLAADIERMLAGESGVLVAPREKPTSFVRTSGTTGASKWIPITPSLAREVATAQRIWMVEMLRENPKHPDGAPLTLVSRAPTREAATPGGTPSGANTGRMRNTMPWYVRWAAIPHDDILAVEDELTRAYLVTLASVGADVGNLTTANATTVLLLIDRIEKWRERLLADLESGGVPERVLDDEGNERAAQLPPGGARRLRRRFKRRPAAAERLRSLEPGWTLADLWPRLTTVSCWRGGVAPFFLDRLRPRLGNLPVRDPGYSASEGFFGIPIDSGTAAGVLNVDGPFFEFVPAGERDTAAEPTLLAHELTEGAEYHVVVTTCGGLYRYDMGDVVRVEGRWQSTPRIAFVRKSAGVLNATGEKLTEPQVTEAMRVATEATGARVREFTLTLYLDMPPAVELLAEPVGAVDADAFSAALDEALRDANEEYASKRSSSRMGPPRVRWLAAGAFERLRQARAAAGAPETQVKVPAVTPPDAIPESLKHDMLESADG